MKVQDKKFKQIQLLPFIYLSPSLVSILVLALVPMIYTVVISFTNYNLRNLIDYEFVGFENYKEIITGSLSQVFVPVFIWNVTFAVLATASSFFVGLFLALLLNNDRLVESTIYKTILIFPWSLPGALSILSWKGLLNESYGGINGLLNVFGIPDVSWLSDPFFARMAILTVSLWLSYPFMMNGCLGILQSINPNLYEAAEIDGANRLAKFRCITFPSIVHGALPLMITAFAGNFNNFGVAYLIMMGNPPRADTHYAGYTDILMSAGYKLTTQNFRYDLAAALSVIIFLIVGTLTFISMKTTGTFKEVD